MKWFGVNVLVVELHNVVYCGYDIIAFITVNNGIFSEFKISKIELLVPVLHYSTFKVLRFQVTLYKPWS